MTDATEKPQRDVLDILRRANADGLIGFAHPGRGQNDWYDYPEDLRLVRECQRLGYIVFKKDASVGGHSDLKAYQQRDIYEVTEVGRKALDCRHAGPVPAEPPEKVTQPE